MDHCKLNLNIYLAETYLCLLYSGLIGSLIQHWKNNNTITHQTVWYKNMPYGALGPNTKLIILDYIQSIWIDTNFFICPWWVTWVSKYWSQVRVLCDIDNRNDVTLLMSAHSWSAMERILRTLIVAVYRHPELCDKISAHTETGQIRSWHGEREMDLHSIVLIVSTNSSKCCTLQWQRLPCKMPTTHQEQFGVQYLAQGYLDMQPA